MPTAAVTHIQKIAPGSPDQDRGGDPADVSVADGRGERRRERLERRDGAVARFRSRLRHGAAQRAPHREREAPHLDEAGPDRDEEADEHEHERHGERLPHQSVEGDYPDRSRFAHHSSNRNSGARAVPYSMRRKRGDEDRGDRRRADPADQKGPQAPAPGTTPLPPGAPRARGPPSRSRPMKIAVRQPPIGRANSFQAFTIRSRNPMPSPGRLREARPPRRCRAPTERPARRRRR